MKFNHLINSVLKEDETPSREARAQAMRNLEEPVDRARREARREREEQEHSALQRSRSKWSNPAFQRVTREHIIHNEPGGEYSVEFTTGSVIYNVEYDCGDIDWDGEDTVINNWDVVSITANLKKIFGEDYYVVIRKEQNPEEYEHAEYKAYEQVVEKEGRRLEKEWNGQ